MPSSSTPIEKSLQRSRPRQRETPACQARRVVATNCTTAPSRRTRKWDDTRSVPISGKSGWAAGWRQLVKKRSIASPPYSPGGRLIECTTSSVTRSPLGRSSWFGEATKRQGARRPSGPSFILVAELSFPDVEALHAVAQLPEGDAEELRGRGAIEAGFRERLEDRLALDRIQVVGQRLASARGGRSAWGGRRGEAQIVKADLVAAGQRERALEDVLELADVAGEVMLRQAPERRARQARRQRPGLARESLEGGPPPRPGVLPAPAQRRAGQAQAG